MAEPRASDPFVAPGSQRPHFEPRRRSWRKWIGNAFFLLIVAIAFYSLGRYSAAQQLEEYKIKNVQLANDNGKLNSDNKAQTLRINELQDQVKDIKSKLDEVISPARNLEIKANESRPVSIALMEIGMVGTPTNESVNINVNGKRQVAAAGDVIGADFACRIQVVSIDLLKSSANITTACAVKR